MDQTYEDASYVTYDYDNSGALATVYDSETDRTTTYYYDFTDRMMKYVESGDNYSHSVGYEYDNINNLTALVETINGVKHTTSYDYDKDNRVTSVTADGTTKSYTYDGYGRVTQRVTKRGEETVLTETLTYWDNASGAPTSQVKTHRTQSAGYDVTNSYTYDGNGNILTISDGTYTTTYTYDSANQLIREDNQKRNKTALWVYDAAGNMLGEYSSSYTTAEVDISGEDPLYVYDEDGMLTEIDRGTYVVDTIGNITLDQYDNGYTYKHGRQLSEFRDDGDETEDIGHYFYNADGLLVKVANDYISYNYTYNGTKLTQLVITDSKTITLTFTYGAEGTPSTVAYNGTTYYYATNLQGDVTAILDSTGTAVVTYTYDAWGYLLSTGGTMAYTLGRDNPLRYRGYIYERDSGLYYLRSRFYDPYIRRFISPDAYASTGQGILGNNMYAYCHNNPVLYVDPSGFIIVLSADATKEQIAEYERAIAYLETSETGRKLINNLTTSSEVFTISFIDDDNMCYDFSKKTIFFDTNSGLIVGDGVSVQSAALGLAHEMGHAAQDLAGEIKALNGDVEKIEAQNLEMYETPIAKELGEPIRNHYNDVSGVKNMQNSIHFITTYVRPWWHYILFWHLFTPNTTDHNVSN